MTRLGITEIPPLSLVELRLAVATLAFLVTLIAFKRKLPREPRTLMDIAVVGITNMGVPLMAFTIALKFISSAVLTVFITMIPLFTGLMAHVWLPQERLNRIKAAGMVLAFAGVIYLLITRTTGLAESAPQLDIRGQILGLGGAVVAAAAGVYTRLRLRRVDIVVVTAGQMAVGLLAVAPVALALSNLDLSAITWRGWVAVTYTGIVGSFVAFLLIFYMIQRFGATAGALPAFIMPAVAAVLGTFILGEVITVPLILGAGLILSGVFMATR